MNTLKIWNIMRNNFAGKIVLWICAQFYGVGVALKKYLYDSGIFKKKSVNSRVICFGNITTGGTGKTTAVILAARALAEAGIRVAIVSRGYKRSCKELVILSEDKDEPWIKTGDEPYMMHETLKDLGVPVIVSADRYEAAQTAVRKFRAQAILLDDGFQHYKLDRDANILLVDARNPFGYNALLPLGTLREPLSALDRADLVLITHSDQVPANEIEVIKDEIAQYNNHAEIICSMHQPEYYLDICKAEKIPLEAIKGPATALSAIGEPESFEDTLRSLGMDLRQIWRYPDHHPFTLDELQSAEAVREGHPIITTYKDFTRFPEGWRDIFKENVYVLSIHLNIRGGEEEEVKWLDAVYPKLTSRKQGY